MNKLNTQLIQERKILRFLVSDDNKVGRMARLADEKYFIHSESKQIFNTIKEIIFLNFTMNPATIISEMAKNVTHKILPPSYITNLFKMQFVDYKEAFENLGRLRDSFKLRKAIEMSKELSLLDLSNFDKLKEVLLKFSFLSEEVMENEPKTLQELNKAYKQEILEEIETGISSEKTIEFPFGGFEDQLRLRSGGLYTIAGRPAMGKTSFASQAVLRLMTKGYKTFFVSLEVEEDEIREKITSMITKIPVSEFKKLDSVTRLEKVNEVEAILEKHSGEIIIAESVLDDVDRLLTEVRKQKKERNIDFVAIDYLQLMQVTGKRAGASRNDEVTTISRKLKIAALELGLIFLDLSQLNRGVEQRDNKRPLLSDLRESGSIEQDSTAVLFLYNDEYYNGDSSIDKGITEIIISKNRHGATGTVKLKWIPELTMFKETKQV